MNLLKKIKRKVSVHSLQAQLILYFTFFSLLVLAAGAYMNYRYTWDLFENNNKKYLLQQFHQADSNISTVINDVDRLSKIFIADENIQNFLEENYNSEDFSAYELQEAIFKRIEDFTSGYSDYKPYSYINSIYIYTENKGCIGGNERHNVLYHDEADTKGFFSSDFYPAIRNAFPKIVLAGGMTETFYRNYATGAQPYIISIAREIKPTLQPNRSASLIFNVDERYIASIYANISDPGTEKISILDGSGKVISSSDEKAVGGANPLYGRIPAGSESGSFTLQGGSVPTQVVYSKLSNTQWYLVGEIPLSYLTQDMVVLQRIAVFVFLSSIVLIFLVSFFWLKNITKPLSALARKMQDMGRGELGLTIAKVPGNEFGIVIKRFNEMSLGIKDLMKRQEEIQQEKRELEIEALQSQINPHFLYNTLNMVKWMAAIIKARNIVDCIVALGNILQPAFQNTNALFSLQEEISYLENYIKIVNWRFDDRVHFEFSVAEDLLGSKVPRFVLQPIIENSITHGLTDQPCGIRIRIEAERAGRDMTIVVSDTGTGIPETKLQEIRSSLEADETGSVSARSESIGIPNVHRRIRLNFGLEYGISILSTEGSGTRVSIRVPILK